MPPKTAKNQANEDSTLVTVQLPGAQFREESLSPDSADSDPEYYYSSPSSVDEEELEEAAAAAVTKKKCSRRKGSCPAPASKQQPKRSRKPSGPPSVVDAPPKPHPAAGLQEDLERFLRGFVEFGAARFTAFAEQFRSARLTALVYGRGSLEELADFVQCLFHLLILYTQPPHQTLVRIGAVYLLYAYWVKLADIMNAPIRLSLSQWQKLSELRHQLTQEGHCDALYCLRYLRLRCAFQMCAQPLPCYPAAPPALCSAAEAARSRLAGDFEPLRRVLGEERLETLRALHTQYSMLKAPLAVAAPALRVVDDEAVDRLDRACCDPAAFSDGAAAEAAAFQ